MIDDMGYHIKAWFHILNDQLGASLNWKEVKSHMYGKNSDVLKRVFGAERFTDEEMNVISIEKEKRYQQEFFPQLQLLPGLSEFFRKARKGNIDMAIGSAAIRFNVDFVLNNLNIRHFFKAVVSADDVLNSKPEPETFLNAAALMEADPSCCIVFEDAPKGVEAAVSAGMQCVVLTTMHDMEEFSHYNNILAFIKDYTDPYCNRLIGEIN